MNITQKNLQFTDPITRIKYSFYPVLQTMNGKTISFAITYAQSDVLSDLYGLDSTNLLWVIDVFDMEIDGLERHLYVYSNDIDECFWCLESDVGEIEYIDSEESGREIL